MDIFTKEKRSEIMSKVRSTHTQPEVTIFRGLRKRGIYFQEHHKINRISIDLALPRKKKAVFIDGDFWHGYKFNAKSSKLPKKYWIGKIEGNIVRDKRNRSYLRRNGWKTLRVWEHEILNSEEKTLDKIQNFLIDS